MNQGYDMNKTFNVEASAVIDAPPAAVYGVIADYRVAHPAIVPKPYFSEFTIEQGGQGAGTVLHATITIFGRTLPLHQSISEPEPGHVILETDLGTGQTTTFTFDPVSNGAQTRLTIASVFPTRPGLMGWIERLTTPSVIRRLYQQELENINAYVKKTATSSPAN